MSRVAGRSSALTSRLCRKAHWCVHEVSQQRLSGSLHRSIFRGLRGSPEGQLLGSQRQSIGRSVQSLRANVAESSIPCSNTTGPSYRPKENIQLSSTSG